MVPLATVLLSLVPQAQDHSPLHPAGAGLFAQAPDLQALVAAYEESAYAKLITDPELRAAIGKVMGIEDFDPAGMLVQEFHEAREAGEEMGSSGVVIGDAIARAEANNESLSLRHFFPDLKAVSFSLGLRDNDLGGLVSQVRSADSEDEGAQRFLDSISLQVVVELASERAATKVLDLLFSELSGAEREQVEETAIEAPHGTITRWMVNEDDPFAKSLRLYQDGGRLVFALGDLHRSDELTRFSGKGHSGAERMGTLGASLRAPSGPAQVVVVNRIGSQCLDLIEAEADLAGSSGLFLQLLESLGGSGVSMLLRNGVWQISTDAGRFYTRGIFEARTQSSLDQAIGSQNLTERSLAFIHPEAIAGGIVALDSSKVVEWLDHHASQGDRFSLNEIQQEFDFEVIRDLVKPLGSAVAWSLRGKLGLSAPPFDVTAAVTDPVAFRKGLSGLLEAIAQGAGPEVSIRRRNYRGHELITIELKEGAMGNMDNLGLPVDPAKLVQPTFMVLDDRVVMTLNTIHAKRELRRVLKGKAELNPALAGAAIPEGGAGEVAFADWIELLGSGYSMAKGFAPMAGEQFGPGVDLTALPQAEVFMRHFLPSHEWKRREGDLFYFEGESSFGIEANVMAPAMIAGATGSLWFFGARRAAPMPELVVGPVRAPEGSVHDHGLEPIADPARSLDSVALEQIPILQAAALRYQQNNGGQLPSEIGALFLKDTNGQAYAPEALESDPWGTKYLYWVAGDGSRFAIWSAGPNGIDESGEADDVILGGE